MPNLIHGQDPGGALKPIQVDDNGNLSVDIVSGVAVSVVVDGTTSLNVNASQVSGHAWSTVVNSGDLLVRQVSGEAWSTAISAPVEALQISGHAWSTVVNSGDMVVRQVSGEAWSTAVTPIAIGLNETNDSVLRTTIMTDCAVSTASKLSGFSIRSSCATAYLALSTGTEATLLAGVAATYLDLVSVVAANTSDVAVNVTFRDKTGGGEVLNLQIPANGTAGAAYTIPIPQDVAAQPWTADMADITGTTVNISALFVKNT